MASMKLPAEELLAIATEVIEIESSSLRALQKRLGDNFYRACEYLLNCRGRIVVTGMGKSGHIGGKIAATLASTGSPAFFVHPGEASHGDLGMITAQDVVLAISNSGNTDELLNILPLIKRQNIPLISMTGNPQSALAQSADINLDIGVEKEACPLNLAPTSSTTVTLALGDALAVCLLKLRGFTADDFARSHPGGKLGKRLILTVADVMHQGDEIPAVNKATLVKDALMEISQKGLGFTCVMDGDELLGVYTDGDLRRSFDEQVDIHSARIDSVMTKTFTTIESSALAVEGLNTMESNSITSVPVLDAEQNLVGALHMHDLLRAGVI